MSIGIQDQNFGVEYEFSGMYRKEAAEVLARYFGTSVGRDGGYYDKYYARDAQGRKWTIMSDASVGGRRGESCELVTPICQYSDIPTIQQLVRELKAAGSEVNSSCGVHIHIDGRNHSAKSIRNLSLIIASKEAPMATALQIAPNRLATYCRPTDPQFAEWLKDNKEPSLSEIKEQYYGNRDHNRGQHYSDARYHMLNLHSFFGEYHGCNHTVEFRCFNSTKHAGKMKAYIQFCLAVSSQAIRQTNARLKPMERSNDAYVFRTWLNRAKLIGDEYKTCRHHMLAHLQGDLVYHDRANVRHRTARCAEEMNTRIRLSTAQTSNPETASITELPAAPSERPDIPSFTPSEQTQSFIQALWSQHTLTAEDRNDIMEIYTADLNRTQRQEIMRMYEQLNPERNITQAQTQTTQRTRRVSGGD